MQKSDSGQLTTAHRRVKGSTTLNRKYVRRPVVASNAVKVRMQQVRPAETKTKATVSQQQRKLTASELRDLAIKKALAEADNYSEQENTQTKMAESIKMDNEKKTSSRKGEFSAKKVRFGIGRVFLAFGCAVAVVVGIVYLVNANMPDISLKVAAMQTGIDNPYPSYVPRDYNVSDVVSENGKITISFKNHANGGSFSLVEERSSWDSGALLANYVKEAYKEDYTVIREQGLTLYLGRNETVWVNGGVFYKLKLVSGTLTKKQIRSIAVSL